MAHEKRIVGLSSGAVSGSVWGVGVAISWLLGSVAVSAQTPPPKIAVEHSVYVTARDGTRLAVDIYLPRDREAKEKHPTLFEFTRYQRSTEDPATGAPRRSLGRLDRYLRGHGYALAKVDARGSGASFGTRPVEYGPEEVRDAYDVVDWVVKQPWSDGAVGAYGTSYSGTTSELLCAVNHPAVKAVIPGWSDFDLYPSPVRPYGLLASEFIRKWSQMVGFMDENNVEVMGGSVRRVSSDKDGKLLAAAVAEHKANPDVFAAVQAAEFRDDVLGGKYTYRELHPLYWKEQIERSKVPMLVLVSWLDAGTAAGALLRFQHFKNPQKVVIMASNHGGGSHASPYTVGKRPLPPRPSSKEQFELRRDFLDFHLRGKKNGFDKQPALRFFNLGEEAFHTSATWPPSGMKMQPFFLAAEKKLARKASAKAATDTYRVDPNVSTGNRNRWMTQMGGPVLRLDDRGEMDKRMLCYTTPPLDADLQIAGTPVVSLRISSDHADGMVLAYLEDVDESGRSRYVTEGGLRLIHRRTSPPPLKGDEPYHTFARAHAAPMKPGEVAEVTFQLWPIAALIKKGHRLRLAIAGADKDTFDPLPAKGTPTLTLHRGPDHPSRLDLPVVIGGLKK